MKRTLCLLLTALFVMLPAFANGDRETVSTTAFASGVTKSDETLVVMMNSEPTKLFGDSNESGVTILDAIDASVLEYDSATRSWTWGLADSYEKIDDTHYLFHLRDGIEFSDGTPITAADVVYSLGVMNSESTSDALMFKMDEMEVVDDSTFIFALTSYVPGWQFFLSENNGSVFSKAGVEAFGGVEACERKRPASSGKYTLKEWKSGEYVLLERNDNYYDREYEGYYRYIKFMFVSDSASRVLAVQSGDADVANRISASEYVMLRNDSTVSVVETDCGVVYNVLFNNESGVCADRNVREALCYAIDGAAVNAVINMGMGETAQGWLPSFFPYYRDYGYPEYNPEKARELLKKAGYPDGLTLSCYVISTHVEMATVIQESLRKAGVELDVEVVEQNVYVQKVRSGDYDIQVGNTTNASVNTNAFNPVSPAKVGKSVQSCRITDPAVTEYIALCNSADETVQAEGWKALTDYVFGNYCLKGLCNGRKYDALKSGLGGLRLATRMGYIDVTGVRPL